MNRSPTVNIQFQIKINPLHEILKKKETWGIKRNCQNDSDRFMYE